jgi:hypothetical protein
MATLSLARRDVCFDVKLATATPLSEWLGGRWGLVFSHPEDFACLDFEADRWLTVVKDALASANVRPLAVFGTRPRFATWIEQLDGSDPLLVLEQSKVRGTVPSGTNVSTLRSAIARATSRFVMIVDDALNLRRTFTYSRRDRLPSLLDLVATIELMQREHTPKLDLEREPTLARVLRMPRRPRAVA